MFIKSGVLSNNAINKLLGKKIFIYPFNEKNLKGSTYNMTASTCAYIIKPNSCGCKESQQIIVNSENQIVIPPHSTALIETDESLYVDSYICGTYHSKVGMVKRGLSHIGTTLDPEYFGTSLISVQNMTGEEKRINVGETFVSIMFYKLATKSNSTHDNQPFRSDLIDINSMEFNEDNWKTYDKEKGQAKIKEKGQVKIKEDIKSWKNQDFRQNVKSLKKSVKAYVKKRDKEKKIRDAVILGSIIGIILELILLYLIWMLNKAYYNNFIIGIAALMATIIPSITIIVNIVIRNIENSVNRGE